MLDKGQFGIAIHPVMCSCSMIFLSPRKSRSEYQKIYAESYDKDFRLELKPDYGEAYHNLGFAHQENGDLETGLIYYKKAARLGVKEIQSWLKENGYKW